MLSEQIVLPVKTKPQGNQYSSSRNIDWPAVGSSVQQLAVRLSKAIFSIIEEEGGGGGRLVSSDGGEFSGLRVE